MTNEQALEQQVEVLEKLLQLKQALIEELEAKVQRIQVAQIPSYPITVPYMQPYVQPYVGGTGGITIAGTSFCPDGTPHQYPNSWSSNSGQPCCTKCGQVIYSLAGNLSINSSASSYTFHNASDATGNVASLQITGAKQ